MRNLVNALPVLIAFLLTIIGCIIGAAVDSDNDNVVAGIGVIGGLLVAALALKLLFDDES